ncbi:MAG TPA: pyridoxal phosphate-dependent aminotransferase family protein [Clostridia bacterium]|nr:MAG: 8-amino-7-oxononanoate synthase [Firmicutes bacterium ADurb.Bin146]HOD93999.1 pyridoxal phosphate-dependent aminotransferase family protein [Clostridia bacterium]HQM39301.1 pyridoxal phosphate-dependent aminotransferase family protein [Clostridia bacterium]
MDIFQKCYKFATADEIREIGIYPYFHALQSRQDTEVIMEGKRKIMLGSNNYLGLTTNPDVIKAGLDAIERYGTGCSGSRFLNGTLQLHLELENELAEFLNQESALVFSTGFQTNLGIISAIAGHNDYLICDKENHASIYDGCKLSYGTLLRYRHNDMKDLENQLKKVPETSGALIITDGVFSMGGDIANLPQIVDLAKKYGARVMVDDSHGLGVIGEKGRGTASYYKLEKEVDIYMGTFSKSLASLGGFMAADEKIIDYVRHSSRPFIFSASMTPSSCAVALTALRHLKAHPELPKRLTDISSYFRRKLKEEGIKTRDSMTPIIPIYTYEMITTLTIAKELYDEGVYVNCSLPPATAPNECLLRTSLMATHTEALIDEAVMIIKKVLERHNL